MLQRTFRGHPRFGSAGHPHEQTDIPLAFLLRSNGCIYSRVHGNGREVNSGEMPNVFVEDISRSN
jgi:hypothetical protein